jgi:polyhydroxyalkanoate synthesis regulator protein
MKQPKNPSIVIKRYVGGRLYDTSVGRYVTIEDLKKWANGGIALVILDRETGQDITAQLMG